jgi:hypothetical protein
VPGQKNNLIRLKNVRVDHCFKSGVRVILILRFMFANNFKSMPMQSLCKIGSSQPIEMLKTRPQRSDLLITLTRFGKLSKIDTFLVQDMAPWFRNTME